MNNALLEEASAMVAGPRHEAYGHPWQDFTRTAVFWSEILRVPVTAAQVGLCMIALKLSREVHQHGHDNLVDIAGYAQAIEHVHAVEPGAEPSKIVGWVQDGTMKRYVEESGEKDGE